MRQRFNVFVAHLRLRNSAECFELSKGTVCLQVLKPLPQQEDTYFVLGVTMQPIVGHSRSHHL